MPALFTAWFPIPGTAYSGTSFEISNGVHTIQHEDPTITLSVIVYGNADKESYGFPAGMRLATINAVSLHNIKYCNFALASHMTTLIAAIPIPC